MRVCAVAAQPGHTKELQSLQLERGLRIVDSPGVIFDDGSHPGPGVTRASAQCRQTFDDPISVGRWALLPAHLLDLNSRPLLVEEILARAQTETLMTIYDLPTFSSTLVFLTMLALSTGRLLKASPISSPSFLSFKTQTDFHSFRAVLPTSSSQRVKYSSTGTTKGSGSSPNHPCCMLRIYRLRFPEAAGKLLRAPRQQAMCRS
jgi:hypothetical protein